VLLIAGVLGMVVGLLAGGRLSNLLSVKLRYGALILLALVLRFGTQWLIEQGVDLVDQLRVPLFAVAFGMLVGALWLNRSQSGLLLAMVGVGVWASLLAVQRPAAAYLVPGSFIAMMLVGAVANPFLKPLELNMLRLGQKVGAGAKFIQTHAVFDVEAFGQWLGAARNEGITKKAAILAGVLPLESAAEAEKLRDTYTDHYIPDEVVKRLKAAGDDNAQKKEGLAICVETIKKLKQMEGLRGIHVLSGGKEKAVAEILAAAGL